jgi:hypothetical protein
MTERAHRPRSGGGEPILDIARRELKMGGNLDGARRTACINEVWVDP